ncbi:hypothetical protein HBA91_00965 [Ochrobactrum sp. MR34]|nr:hypothetical protein [Ochrobactrum sp. MR34]
MTCRDIKFGFSLHIAGTWKPERNCTFKLSMPGPQIGRVISYKVDMTYASFVGATKEFNSSNFTLCLETKHSSKGGGTVRVPILIPPHDFENIIATMLDVDTVATFSAFVNALNAIQEKGSL